MRICQASETASWDRRDDSLDYLRQFDLRNDLAVAKLQAQSERDFDKRCLTANRVSYRILNAINNKNLREDRMLTCHGKVGRYLLMTLSTYSATM
jgi:hypothetical protein